MVKDDVDVLIIGGGLIGATLLLALNGHGLKTLLVEAQAPINRTGADFDARSLALSPASIHILQMLAIWPLLKQQATPIQSIHVSEKKRFGKVLLNGNTEPLGYVLEMQDINRALHNLLPTANTLVPAELVALTENIATIKHKNTEKQIKARLIVAADGAQSSVRRLTQMAVKTKNYQQQAIISNIGLNRSHNNRAYERFTQSGLLAMLPMTENRVAMVWALESNDAIQKMSLNETAFLKAVQQEFGYRLGRFIKIGKRFVYPLQQSYMPEQIKWPFVFVGNAAHTLHPVAGQGFNLGLRDVATLAQCIIQQGINEAMLRHYLAMRDYDQKAIRYLTNGLSDLFTQHLPGLGLLRSLGLLTMNTLPTFKTILARHAGGFAGQTPDLVCDIPLPSTIAHSLGRNDG